MRLELKDIKGGVLEQEYSCSLEDFPDLNDLAGTDALRFQNPLNFKLRLQRTGKFVEVDGRLEAVVGLNCGRCLQGFELSLSESFSVTFVPHGNEIETEEEVELGVEELGLVSYSDETIDLHDALQEQLLMAAPISPICRQDCRGLCPECGANLNIEKCDCTGQIFNNKFKVLAGIDFKKT